MKNLLTAWIVCKTLIFCLTIIWEIHAPHIHVLHHQSCHHSFSLLYICPSTFCQFMISSIIVLFACINKHVCNQLSPFCLFICTNGQATTWDFITYMRASPWKRLCFFYHKEFVNYNVWCRDWNMRNTIVYVAIIMGVGNGLFFLDNQVNESSLKDTIAQQKYWSVFIIYWPIFCGFFLALDIEVTLKILHRRLRAGLLIVTNSFNFDPMNFSTYLFSSNL